MGEFAIGQPVSRFEDPRLLRGGGRYVDDIVLPRMAFGTVLRSPHAHARIRSIDTAKAQGRARRAGGAHRRRLAGVRLRRPAGAARQQAPRRLADVPAALSGAGEGSRALGRRLRRLRGRRDAPSGDGRGRADRGRLRAAAGDHRHGRRGALPARRACGTIARTISASCSSRATRRQPTRPSRARPTWSSIASSSTASPRPPWSRAARSATTIRPTAATRIYTTLQRAHGYKSELANLILKVPESKVRVVAGDIGGSFGMKSAIYNEVALVLLASKLTGRPVKWVGTRSESFLGDAQARDNVTEAELALDKDGIFLGMRVKSTVNAGAYLQTGMPAFTGNLGTLAGVYRTPAHACGRDGRVHAHQPDAALSRQRPSGGRLCDRAHGRSRGATSSASIRPNCGGATTSRPRRCRSRPASPSPMTAASSRRTWTWRSSSPTSRASRRAARKRASAASCAGSASPTPSSAPPRRASRAPRSASIAPAGSRCSPARSRRARGTRPCSSRSSATGSACIRTRSITSRATPTRCSSAKAPVARAPPP